MKKHNRIIALTSVILSASMLLAACSGNPETPSSSTQPSSQESNAIKPETEGTGSEWFKKYDPPITITTHTTSDANNMFHEGADSENNGQTRWIEENLGIKFKMSWVAPDGATNTQKLDLAFASDDLPDVIDPSVSQIAKFAAAGKLQPIDDILEKNASPFFKWHIEDALKQTQGKLWAPFMADGKTYAMPNISDTLAFWTVNFMRDDIVKEMGMALPKTLEELEKVFETYHAKYPNGYALGMDKDLNGMTTAMTAYEAYPSKWVEKDGSLVYGSIQPETRDALAKLADWYKKGYIDPEFVVKDGAKVSEDVSQGNILTHYGHWASIAAPFTPMWNNLPDSTVDVVPFVTGARAITTSCKNPEALVYLYNESLDSYYRNDQGLRDMLKKDYNYDFKYPVTPVREPTNAAEVLEKYPNIVTPKQLWLYEYTKEEEGPGFINDYYVQPGGWYGFAGKPVTVSNADFASMAEADKTGDESVLTPEGKQMYDQWNGTHPNMVKTFSKICNYWNELSASSDVLHPNAYAGAPTQTMTEKQSYLDKLQLETYTRIIMGTQPIEAFDEFVKNWNQNGGEQITVEVNEWYAQFK